MPSILYDPDPSAAPASGAPAPAPAAAPPPAAPPQPSLADLTKGAANAPSDQYYEVPFDDGSTRLATLSQLADAYVAQGTIDPQDLEAGKLLRQAIKNNDPVAAQQLIAKFGANPAQTISTGLPSGQPPVTGLPPSAASPTETQLRQQVENLERKLNSVLPLTSRIQNLQEEATIKGDIVRYASELPYASQHPQAATRVMQERNRLVNEVRAAGYRPDTPQASRQIYAQALRNVDAAIRYDAEVLGKVRVPGAPASGVVADQSNGRPVADAWKYNGTTPREIITLGNGQTIDRATGLPVRQTPTGELQIVSGPPPAPSGGMPIMTPDAPAPGGPVTMEGLRDRMKSRLAQLKAGGMAGG